MRLWRSTRDETLREWRTFRWLTLCARLVLRVRRPLVIGVTGSVGKTTTVEFIHAVLDQPAARAVVGEAWRTPRNMNDGPNLPLVLLGFDRFLMTYQTPRQWLGLAARATLRTLRYVLFGGYPRVLVLELGTSRPGRIASLTRFVRPQVGVVTAIGPAHLAGLGSMAGIVEEKGALLRGLKPPALAILGEDHDWVDHLARQAPGEVIRVPGRSTDLAAAIARIIATRLGIPAPAIEAGLAGACSQARRLEVIQANGITIIDDSFNANPLSMRLALDTLAAMPVPPGGRRVAVLGEMGELGEEATHWHRQVGSQARSSADLVFGVGELASHYRPDLAWPDSEACAQALLARLQAGDCVLVKGSGSVKLGPVVEALRGWRGEDAQSVDGARRRRA